MTCMAGVLCEWSIHGTTSHMCDEWLKLRHEEFRRVQFATGVITIAKNTTNFERECETLSFFHGSKLRKPDPT